MSPRDIPEIRDAEAELRRAEASFPSYESAEMFKDAFEALDDFAETASQSDEVVRFVDNLKLSYTRTIVTHLNEIETKDFDKYISYAIVLFLRMQPTLSKLTATKPEIIVLLNECKQRFLPQVEELARRFQPNGV
jgi:hypothetical protein